MKNITKGIFGKKNVLKHVTLDGVRLHLRTDERKLWINGYYVLYLNKTANKFLSHFIDSCYEVPQERIISRTIAKIQLRHPFISYSRINKDLHNILGIINSFARNEIPTNLVGMGIIEEENRTAPNRMDISLTYECNNNCPHCYLLENKDTNGILTTDEWESVIDKLWEIGVPQIVFTGGECTLRKDLVKLVDYSKQFVTGIISNGTNITLNLAKQLRKAELDWIQITLESNKEKIHDEMQGRKGAYKETIQGIKNCIKAGLQVSINMTLIKKNKNDLKGVLDLAKKLGINIVSTNAIIRSGRGIKSKEGISEKELKKILIQGNKYAQNKGIEFNWFLPTCYKNLNPIKLGFGQRCCSACSVNMMVSPNGDVLPCQSWTHEKLGNILEDEWKSIWNNKLSQKIRNFGYAKEKCKECKYFNLCGGACPLDIINCRKCRK